MIVLKFGGTSLADAPHIQTIAGIVRNTDDERPVVVVSAHAGVTDLLDSLADRALKEKSDIREVRSLHRKILGDLSLPWQTLGIALVTVLAVGMGASLGAVALTSRMPLLPALKGEN